MKRGSDMWRTGVLLVLLLALLGTASVADDMDAISYGGRTMVPLRTVSEFLGASVQYDSRTNGVSISLDYQKVNMAVGSTRARVGDRSVLLDSPVVVVGSVCYVPARFVTSTFGCSINWDSADHRVIVVNPREHRQIVLMVSRRVPPGLAKMGGIPPGLAKKGGIPPGLAKRYRRADDWDAEDVFYDHGHGRKHGGKEGELPPGQARKFRDSGGWGDQSRGHGHGNGRWKH